MAAPAQNGDGLRADQPGELARRDPEVDPVEDLASGDPDAEVLDFFAFGMRELRERTARFLRHFADGKPRLPLEPLADPHRPLVAIVPDRHGRGTNALLQTVKGTVWLTETGGVVKFTTQSGKVALPKSESRAKRAMASERPKSKPPSGLRIASIFISHSAVSWEASRATRAA